MWAHVPGLIVALPSTPADAKGLMKTALRAADPVIILETKALFASKGEVPEGNHLVPFGVARIVRSGSDLTIATAGQLVDRAFEAADRLAAEGIDCEIVDLRTIMPLDVDTVATSVRKTHRLLIVDEGYAMCGVGAELGQAMQELVFDELDAPVGRVHTEPVIHPLAPALERAMLVDAEKIVAAAKGIVSGAVPVPVHWRHATGMAPALPAAPPVARTAPRKESPQAETPASVNAEPVNGEPITMPFGDLTISEGKIVRWAKAVGDTVAAGELVAEIETDKAVVEIEAPVAGVIAGIEQPVGAIVPMGGRIGVVRPADADATGRSG